jgi:hypothetical protein
MFDEPGSSDGGSFSGVEDPCKSYTGCCSTPFVRTLGMEGLDRICPLIGGVCRGAVKYPCTGRNNVRKA